MRLPRLTLVEVFVLATLATGGAMAATFYGFLESSRQSILTRSDALREAAADRVGERVTAELGVAVDGLRDIDHAMQLGALPTDDAEAIEARIFAEIVDRPTLSDISFTHAALVGFDAAGEGQLGPEEGRWQVMVFRASSEAGSPVFTRRVARVDGRFVEDVRQRPAGGGLLAAPFERKGDIKDPTAHNTFTGSVEQSSYGRSIWSDLAWSQLDETLPQHQRRAVMTVQKAIEDGAAKFVGVVRVGLLARTIDTLPKKMALADDPQRVILVDDQGRLVARLDPNDTLELVGNDLRIKPVQPSREIEAALGSAGHSGVIDVDGTRYLATFRPLQTSQHWSAGVIVPEDYYTRDLRALRGRFLSVFLATTAIVLLAGGLLLRLLQRSLGRVIAATGRMRQFDFSPSPVDAPLRDVVELMEGVERAKTSLRTLGKYAPMELVRRLYESNKEPELGGELMEISLLFTDIEGFTSLSEKLSPDALAAALGAYLDAMTTAVQSTGGTVDKFIGDAVMAFWSAPTPQADHALRACRAVVACLKATRALYASDAWKGLAPLFTRYGVHRARVMVGHFGAPERFSYTAMGDGVNLAARLEPLCKQYGVGVLVSEAIVEQAKGEFEFRLVDRVAVKGKDESVQVYELLGAKGTCDEAAASARVYEQALAKYFARDFPGARTLLESLADDPPGEVLRHRCDAMVAHPPPEDWNGVYVAKTK